MIRCALLVLAVLWSSCSTVAPPGQRVPALEAMTLEAKASELFMAWILSEESGQAEARRKLLDEVRAGVLGGVILSTGTMPEARELIAQLQAAAPRPLLIAGDFESGLSMRLKDAPNLGRAMLLGATGSTDLAYRVGEATSVAGRALGFHLCFAPVLDVNNNPANPIINVRSLGEDPAAVARLGAALARGMGTSMIATAKHFPGHGDVTADSHLVLPTVAADRARLDALELRPFRAAIEAGIGAIMTAHLSVPALDPRPNLPATLSKPILTGLLREELGFEGLIVTDALEMGGIQKIMPGPESAVAALRAGADLLLMPKDARAARDAIVAAVRDGSLAESRLDAAVERLLAAKRRFAGQPVVPLTAARLAAHRELGRAVARRGITLVKDAAGHLPLSRDSGSVFVLNLVDAEGVEAGDALVKGLRDYAGRRVLHDTLHPKSSADEIARAFRKAEAAGALIVGMHVRVREFSGKIGLPPQFAGIGAVLRAHPRAVAVSFGNPYLVREFADVSTYICAYDQGDVVEAAVAAAALGRAPITGRLPVSIPRVAAVGAGESRFGVAAGGVREASLEAAIRELLRGQVARGAFPGAVARVTRRGQLVAEVAVGRETYDAGSPAITADRRYDLASLTKVCATLPALAVLLERGVIRLDDRLDKWVPAFQGEGKSAVTIRHAMVHSTGLPAYIRFFKQGLSGKATIVEAAAQAGLTYPPGTKKVYSDLGLILLMAAIEKASGMPFDAFLQREVYPRIGVEARFSVSGAPIDAVPTEDDAWRGRVVRGEVHDENAFAMGGVSGHAGLFGTAADVARIGNCFLGGGGGLIRPALARQLVRRDGMVPGSTRALLFDTFKKGGSGGHHLSDQAFGHTGFTGTSVWCDPATDLCVVLLTNRVHPTRENRKISAARRALHDLVVERVVPR